MSKLLRIVGVAVLGVSLSTAGVVAAYSGNADIGLTGPNSDNTVKFDSDTDIDVDNDADVNVDNDNDQNAQTGDAKAEYNTDSGDVESGDAENENVTDTEVVLDATSSSAAALKGAGDKGNFDARIDTTGPHSYNKVEMERDYNVDLNNNADVDVNNDSDQNAQSGEAKSHKNTLGGDVKSGDASNYNKTTTSVHVYF